MRLSTCCGIVKSAINVSGPVPKYKICKYFRHYSVKAMSGVESDDSGVEG